MCTSSSTNFYEFKVNSTESHEFSNYANGDPPPLTGAKIAIFDQYLALASITAGSIVTIALSRFRRVSL